MLSLTIAGEAVSIKFGAWGVTDSLNARSTMSVTVKELNNLASISKGDPLSLVRDTTVIFKGFVDAVTIQEVAPDEVERAVTAVDHCCIADRRLIVASLSDIYVGDVVTNHILPILAEEGVEAGTIDTGILITKLNFPYYSCAQALDRLSEMTGYYWNIDHDKKLHFCNRATNISKTTLDSNLKHIKFKLVQRNGNYRNIQYLRAGKGQTSEQENELPTPAPDGVSTSFQFNYPLAKEPTIEINTGSGWVSQMVGLKNLTTGKDWYWEYGSPFVTQDSDSSALAAGDQIRATYYGLYDLITVVANQEQIGARKAVEGGTGQYEHLVKNTDINTDVQASEYTSGLLERYGKINNRVSCTIYQNAYDVGQLVPINKPIFGINNQTFLMSSKHIFPIGPDQEGYKIELLDGSDFGGWESLFKSIINDNKKINISENEVAVRIVFSDEDHIAQGKMYVNPVETGLFPSDTLYPSDDLYPNETYSCEEALYD